MWWKRKGSVKELVGISIQVDGRAQSGAWDVAADATGHHHEDPRRSSGYDSLARESMMNEDGRASVFSSSKRRCMPWLPRQVSRTGALPAPSAPWLLEALLGCLLPFTGPRYLANSSAPASK